MAAFGNHAWKAFSSAEVEVGPRWPESLVSGVARATRAGQRACVRVYAPKYDRKFVLLAVESDVLCM